MPSWKSLMAVSAICWLVVVVLLVMIFAAGCTITPSPVLSNTASFDAGVQNSGILYLCTNAAGARGAVVTTNAYARYCGLVGVYSNRFVPPLTPDRGAVYLTTNAWFLDDQALVDFALMSGYRRAEQR